MAITQSLSSKGNVKKLTNNDIPFAPQQPVISSYYATSTAAQTVINMSFSVVASGSNANTDILWLFVDGKKLDLGALNDYQFTSIAADGTSSQITLNFPLPVGLNIQAYKLGLKKELEFQTDNRFVQLYEAQNQGFQGFVNNSSFINTATTTTGTPAAGTFYSSIVGRASMVDISQDLKASLGTERLMTQQLALLQSEFGPNGELVYGVINDLNGQIRFGGQWTANTPTSSGQYISSIVSNDFCEITFYGTGLNLLIDLAASSLDARVSIDGGSEGANVFAASYSAVIDARNYSTNQVLNVSSGLTLGVHTAKIRNNSTNALKIYGFETLNTNSTTSLTVNPGVGYASGQKLVNSSTALSAYNSAFTNVYGTVGTRGGHVLVYQATDGTIKKDIRYTETASAFLGSASHTNEEVARVYTIREFGAGRSDDFSSLGSSGQDRAFTLEDGTATLYCVNSTMLSSSTLNATDGLNIQSSAGALLSFTFVGTGIDVTNVLAASAGYNIVIDGVTQSSNNTSLFSTVGNKTVASGLPYGTHNLRIVFNSAGSGLVISNFRVYQPKTPPLPSGAVMLADYNLMAAYVANSTQSVGAIATGVLRKANTRELTYGGTWGLVSPSGTGDDISGIQIFTTTNTSYWQYTFFGTGFEYRFTTSTSADTTVITVDGSSNLSGFTTSSYGTGVASFTASTGTLVTTTSSVFGNGVQVSNMPLGLHTVRGTVNTATGGVYINALDIITPIYANKSNTYSDLQNSLPVGSSSLLDARKITPVKDSLPGQKAYSQAYGVTANPTTTSTSFVPCPDMSVTVKMSANGFLDCSYAITSSCTSAGNGSNFMLYVDGIGTGGAVTQNAPAGNAVTATDRRIIPLSAGVHKVDVYWLTGAGTMTATGTSRVLTTKEV